MGLWIHVWGHAITDNIRRLWFLKSEPFKQEFKDCLLVYISFEKQSLELHHNFMRLLEICGIDINTLKPITQPTCFDKIILPDESFCSNGIRTFSDEYRETIERVRGFALKNQIPTTSKKIYYFYGAKQIGEERLAEYFKSKGYDVIQPEKLTFDEQLNILINCDVFASTLGSCAHNSIFLKEGTTAIFIPRTHQIGFSEDNAYQITLNQVNSINATYINSTLSFYSLSLYNSSCYIISEQLKRFFGDKCEGYAEEDFRIFLQYVKNSMSKGFVVNSIAKKYYVPIFEDFMAQLRQHEDLIAAYNMPPSWEEQFRQTLTYQTHIHTKGWGVWQNEEQISGSLEDKLDIQAVKINFPNHNIHYSVYYNAKEGWSEEVSNGEQAGTTGKSKSIFGIKIRLDEAGTKEFDILYRVHKFDGEWTDWAKNGECIYSYGQKLNALQIKLEPKRT